MTLAPTDALQIECPITDILLTTDSEPLEMRSCIASLPCGLLLGTIATSLPYSSSRRFHVAHVRPLVHLAGAVLANRSRSPFPLSTSLALVAAVSNRWHRCRWSSQTCLGTRDAAGSPRKFAWTIESRCLAL